MKFKKIIATFTTVAVFTMSSTACINASAATEFCSEMKSVTWTSTTTKIYTIRNSVGVTVGNLKATYTKTLISKKVESVCSVAGGKWKHYSTVMSGGKSSASDDIESDANAYSGKVTLKDGESLHTGAIWVQ